MGAWCGRLFTFCGVLIDGELNGYGENCFNVSDSG